MKHDLRWVSHSYFPKVDGEVRHESRETAWCVCGWRSETLIGDGSDEDRCELERRFLAHLALLPS